MTMRAEPGWRAVLKRPVVRPPEPQDVPGEFLYKLFVMPIRFWGFTVPPFDERLLRKPSDASVPVMPETMFELARYIGSPVLQHSFLQSNAVRADESGRPAQVVHPFPLGKGRRLYANVVDIVQPGETDKEALSRIESVYEHDRSVLRAAQVRYVMES